MQAYFGNITVLKNIDAFLTQGYNIAIKQHETRKMNQDITKTKV